MRSGVAQKSDTFLKQFLLRYICSTGGIHCDNSKSAYIVHWLDQPRHLSPSNPSHSIKAIVLFRTCICNPSSMFPHLSLLHSLSPLPQVPHHTHFTYFYSPVFHYLFLRHVLRRFLMYPHCEHTLLWYLQILPRSVFLDMRHEI
jgi:hypothetical protein